VTRGLCKDRLGGLGEECRSRGKERRDLRRLLEKVINEGERKENIRSVAPLSNKGTRE